MLLKHVGLTCSSQEKADKFFQDLLGLNKKEPKMLPADLTKAIFNLDTQLPIINYVSDNIHFEIFITSRADAKSNPIAHHCLEVDDLSVIIQKCRSLGVNVTQVPKGDKTLTFITDFDGNLFEIKGS